MPGLKELQDECKALGVPSSLIRRHMNDADQLQSLIEGFNRGKQEVRKMARPVARAKAGAKRKTTLKPISRRPAARAAAKPAAKKKVTTVKKATTRKPVTRKPAPKPKPVAARKPTARKPSRVNSNEAGRHEVESVKFNKTDGWNPREGSITSDIFLALKECKGDREKTFRLLLKWAPISEWVPKSKPNGVKRTKDEQEAMLRYRINRTLWDFAIQTGQHVKSENRKPYTTNGKTKPGRPSTRKPVATRRSKPKPKAEAPKRRGRPPGSKNKRTTATARTSTTKRTTTRRSTRRPARARR